MKKQLEQEILKRIKLLAPFNQQLLKELIRVYRRDNGLKRSQHAHLLELLRNSTQRDRVISLYELLKDGLFDSYQP